MYFSKLDLIEVGDMEEVVRKPYDWNTDGSALRDISYAVERNGSKTLSAGIFTDCAGRVLSMSSESEQINIPGIGKGSRAWKDKRFRFIMEVIIEPRSRFQTAQTRAIVSGYTDRAEISHADTIDPETRLYINSVVTVKDMVDSRGRPTTRVVDMSQTLLGSFLNMEETEYLVRPSDMFAHIETNEDLLMSDTTDQVDTRTTFHFGTQLSDRRNNTASNYLFSLINTDVEARDNLATRSQEYIMDTRDSVAHEQLTSNTLQTNRFLRTLANYSKEFQHRNYVTYEDCVDFTEGGSMKILDELTNVYLMKSSNCSYESESWTGASAETLASYQVCHAIPVIMLDCLMDSITFEISNVRGIGGRPEFMITDFTSYVGENIADHSILRAFESRIIHEVFKLISNDNYMTVDLQVEADIGGVTVVNIAIDADPSTRYVFPTFADALTSPIVTSDKERGNELAEGYLEIRKTVDEIIDRNSVIDTTTSLRDLQRSTETRTRQPSAPRGLHNLLDDDLLNNGNFTLKGLDEL